MHHSIPFRRRRALCSLFLLAAWLVFSPAGLSAAGAVRQLKVMSFNIWVNGQAGLPQCIEVMRSSGADIIGLQESNPATTANIATNLGFHYFPGVPIVSRFPLIANLTPGGGSGVTVLLSPGQRVHFFNCHLTAYPYGPYDLSDGKGKEFVLTQENQTRMPALKQLLAAMAPFIAGGSPCFLTGDFNAPSHLDYADFPWPTSLAPAQAGLLDSYKTIHPNGAKFPGRFAFDAPGITWTPRVEQEPKGIYDRIDFVYFSPGDGATPLASTELDGRNSVSPWPSDHRAVLTTFKLTPPVAVAQASEPFPAHQAARQPLKLTLNWLAGSGATRHELFFGQTTPVALVANQTKASQMVADLLPDTQYSWRVDEITPAGRVTGEVWTFRTGVFPKLESARPSYAPGERIVIKFSDGPGDPKDWVGFYPAGAAHGEGGASIDWLHTDGTRQGTAIRKEGELVFPNGLAKPGRYEARFFARGGYELLGSVPFLVTAPAAR